MKTTVDEVLHGVVRKTPNGSNYYTSNEIFEAMQTYFDLNKDEWFAEELERRFPDKELLELIYEEQFHYKDVDEIYNWIKKELLKTK